MFLTKKATPVIPEAINAVRVVPEAQKAEEPKQAEKLPSIIKDPFSMKCIEGIGIHMSTSYDGSVFFWGKVDFKNGNTVGKQEFKGKSLDDVILQVKAFLENLK